MSESQNQLEDDCRGMGPDQLRRVMAAARWLACGTPTRVAMERLVALHAIKPSTARTDITRARKIIRMHALRIHEQSLERHIVSRQLLVTEAWDAGDLKTALSVLQDEAKLLGLYAAPRTDTISAEDLAREMGDTVESDGQPETDESGTTDAIARGVQTRPGSL